MMKERSSEIGLAAALAATLALPGLGCSGGPIEIGGAGGLIGLVVLVLWIVAIVQILQSSRDGMSKLIWILVVLFLPILGTILWFIIGRK